MKRPVPDQIHGVPAYLFDRVQAYFKNMNSIVSFIIDYSIADGHHPDAVILAAFSVIVGHAKGHKAVMRYERGRR
jgi:hypothetical protein